MSRISVDLPAELQAFVDARVRQGNFADAGEYLVALVSAARSERCDIESALHEGLASGPAEEWTSAEFESLKQRIPEQSRAR